MLSSVVIRTAHEEDAAALIDCVSALLVGTAILDISP